MRVSRTKAKLHLLFMSRYKHFARLSATLLREVALYLGPPLLLPALYKASIRLYDLETGQMTVLPSRVCFSLNARYCSISLSQVFCLADSGSRPNVCLIDTSTMTIEVLPTAPTQRIAPGMIHIRPFVYLFGGVFTAEYTGEKYSLPTRTWTAVPPMPAATGSLFPCALQASIYFCLFAASPRFQSFNTRTETYEFHLVALSKSLRPLLLYTSEESVWVVTSQGVVQWKPGEEEVQGKEARQSDWVHWRPNMTPVCVGKWVYWTTFVGDLVQFDRERREINTKETVKSRQKLQFQALCEIVNS